VSGLEFAVLDVVPEQWSAVPALTIRLRVTETTGAPVHALALRAQVGIEPQRRPYTDGEGDRLADVFGARVRWPQTMRALTWAHCSTVTPSFTGSLDVALPLPCGYDLEVVAARYLQALDGGDVPLLLLFSGTLLARAGDGLAVTPVSWASEARHRMPVATWRAAVDTFWPGSGWLRLRSDTLRALQEHRARIGATSWEETVEDLLARAPEAVTAP
jgi:hypothetical protein